MRKTILILALFISAMTQAQELYNFKSGGRVIDDKGQTVSPTQLRNLFSENKAVLDLYNAGRRKKTFGNILLYGGMATLIAKQLTVANDGQLSKQEKIYDNQGNLVGFKDYKISYTVHYIAGAMILAAIPIKIGFSKKIKKAVALMNEEAKSPKLGFVESSSIIINENGVGIAMRF